MTISMKEQDQVPGEMAFPEAKLKALEEKISHTRWVVPVLPEQELEALLVAAIELAEKDDAVSSWKNNIQQCVRSNCEKLVKLCAMKLDDPRCLNLLSVVLNPNTKFHTFKCITNMRRSFSYYRFYIF
ncbi:hypothetical protein ACJJTC_007803 [Scirpophaga incertulas]